RSSHPATTYLCVAALYVGSFIVMHFKHLFNRPRPSRLSPALMPPIDPPGHPAYPSGHATEAYLIALLLEQVGPNALTAPPVVANCPLQRLANHIVRHQEMAGSH